jgi:hypothetical protein
VIVDVNSRQSGRTTRAIDWLAEDINNRAILVSSAMERHSLMRAFQIRHPSVPSQASNFLLPEHNRRGSDVEIYIDNVDMFLQRTLGLTIAGMSVEGSAPAHVIDEEEF